MIQKIRDRSQGWVATFIIGLICIAFAFWGINNYLHQGSGQGPVIASVNGAKISQVRFQQAYARLRQTAFKGQVPTVIPRPLEQRLRQDALQALIRNELLSQTAGDMGMGISESQILSVIRSLPAFQESGRFSPQRFRFALQQMAYSEKDFYESIHTELLRNQLASAFLVGAFALPVDVLTAMSLFNQTRDVGMLVVSPLPFVDKVSVSDAEIAAYYQKHPQDYTLPEQVSVQYVELTRDALLKRISVTSQEVQSYYQKHLSAYSTQPRWQIAHILIPVDDTKNEAATLSKAMALHDRLQAGADFSKLAKQSSADIATATKGGVIGWVKPGVLGANFDNAMQRLSKVGELSPPVRTKYGYSLLKLIGYQKPVVTPLPKVKKSIEKSLRQYQASQRFADLSETLANLAFENPGSLKPIAEQLKLPIKTSELFSRAQAKGMAESPKVVAAAFSDDVLQAKNNSDVIQVGKDKLLVLRVEQHVPATLQKLSAVKKSVRLILQQQKAAAKAKAVGEKLLAEMRSTSDSKHFASLAKKHGFEWQTYQDLGRYASEVNTSIHTIAFALPRPHAGGFSITGSEFGSGNYAILVVTAVKDGETASKTAEKTAMLSQLKQVYGQLGYDLFVNELQSQAKIEVTLKREEANEPVER